MLYIQPWTIYFIQEIVELIQYLRQGGGIRNPYSGFVIRFRTTAGKIQRSEISNSIINDIDLRVQKGSSPPEFISLLENLYGEYRTIRIGFNPDPPYNKTENGH